MTTTEIDLPRESLSLGGYQQAVDQQLLDRKRVGLLRAQSEVFGQEGRPQATGSQDPIGDCYAFSCELNPAVWLPACSHSLGTFNTCR